MTDSHYRLPIIVNKSQEEIDALIKRLGNTGLNHDEQEFFTGCVELATWLPTALQENKITIRQLQRLIFGAKASNKKKKKTNKDESQESCEKDKESASNKKQSEHESAPTPLPPTSADENKNLNIPVDQADVAKRKGHGRNPHSIYSNAIEKCINHTMLKSGDYCPLSCGGRLYKFKPGTIIRVIGNSMATVYRYKVEKLRCALCCDIFTPEIPKNIGYEKYNATFKALVVCQKYYVGTPFYRQENFQSYSKFRLPASDQYKLSEEVANSSYPVVRALEIGVANGDLVQNDDTHAKILSVIKDNKDNPNKERTGMYTSCIMGEMDGNQVALYYTGTKHAGENLEEILRHRDPKKPPIKQMCDALSANLPKTIVTIVCNCLGHGFRKFEELLEFYPLSCLHVITELGKVFKNDEQTRKMSEQERFKYHRTYSKPVMIQLNAWLKNQLFERKVEPNSPLGRSIKYLLKHWKKLRRFLVVPGCPIDNNLVERALKIPIRVRKASMFYKTEHGAHIGSILTSLIKTAILSEESPVEYLVALQENKSHVFANPAAWVPWRYRTTLRSIALKEAA